MKITLINPPQYTRYPQPPIGLALIGAWYEKQGSVVHIIDENVLYFGKLSPIEVHHQDIFAITSMTTTINAALRYALWCKNTSRDYNIQILLGGVHATIFYEQLQKKYGWIIFHKGEHDNLQTLDDWPFLAYHLLPIDKYKPHPPHGKYGRWLPLLSSIGCTYQCSYCSKAVFGNNYRFMSADRVVEEIKYHQKRFGIKEICFYDDVFTLNKNRVYLLCEKIMQSGLKFHWTAETRVNLVDKQMLKFMKEAGCYSVSYGLESGNQEILNKIHKGTSLEQAQIAINLTHELGMETVGYFMLGSPDENHNTISDTITFAKRLPLDYAQFAITTPLPGSELYEIWMKTYNKEIDWNDFRYDGSTNSPVFETKDLTRVDMEFYRSKAYREFYIRPSYMWNKIVGLRSLNDFKILFDGLNMFVQRK
jgi:radical SAM superfamily enzyme YgiQ (UPF0313 family)